MNADSYHNATPLSIDIDSSIDDTPTRRRRFTTRHRPLSVYDCGSLTTGAPVKGSDTSPATSAVITWKSKNAAVKSANKPNTV